MMHEGYFVGRKELSDWIRGNFDPGFNKVEDLASGVVYCKIVDSIYPGAVPMSKVKKDAKIEVDFIHNFKVCPRAWVGAGAPREGGGRREARTRGLWPRLPRRPHAARAPPLPVAATASCIQQEED